MIPFNISILHRFLTLSRMCREKEAQHIVFEAMQESLRYHLVSDVPVGVFLSAGIDSGAILSLAGEDSCKGLQTLSLGV